MMAIIAAIAKRQCADRGEGFKLVTPTKVGVQLAVLLK
jgi:hypothetical protein